MTHVQNECSLEFFHLKSESLFKTLGLRRIFCHKRTSGVRCIVSIALVLLSVLVGLEALVVLMVLVVLKILVVLIAIKVLKALKMIMTLMVLLAFVNVYSIYSAYIHKREHNKRSWNVLMHLVKSK